MNRKTYILDTNVLIHDPESIFHFHEHEVVIPFETLEELDLLKKRYDVIGQNARRIIDSPYLDAASNGLSFLVSRFKGQHLYGHITLARTIRSSVASLAAELL